MKTLTLSAATLMGALSLSGAAQASPATEAFGHCLVQSSTGKDRLIFVQWFFVALAANPNVKSLTNVTPEQRTTFTRQTADVIERLVLVDCRTEALAAIRTDGPSALTTSFELFGRAAANELMSDPAVTKEMSGFEPYIHKSRWESLVEEAKK